MKFPAGIFLLDKPIVIKDKNFVTITGEGPAFRSGVDYSTQTNSYNGLTVFVVGPANNYGFIITKSNDSMPRMSGIQFRNFAMSGSNNRTVSYQNGIFFNSDNDTCQVENVAFAGVSGIGIYNFAGDTFRIVNCQIPEVGSSIVCDTNKRLVISTVTCGAQEVTWGLSTSDITKNTTGISTSFRNYPAGFDGLLGKGIYIANSIHCTITGTGVTPDGWCCLHLVNSSFVNVTGCAFDSYFTGAIMIQGCNHIIFNSNYIKVPGDNITNWNGPSISNNNRSDSLIVGPAINRDSHFGILWVARSTYVMISNNIIYNLASAVSINIVDPSPTNLITNNLIG